MAPGSQSVGDFVSGRVTNGYSGALTLDERRRRMRESSEHVRGSISPRPRRGNLQRNDSTSSRTTSSSIDHVITVRRGDRWDTDTEQLDDTSTVGSAAILDAHQFKIQETGSLHDFADSPVPDDHSVSEISVVTEDDDDNSSVTASVRTGPTRRYQPRTFGGAPAVPIVNPWAGPERHRASSNVDNSLTQINGHSARQHHFSRQSMVGISLPLQIKTQSSSPGLRSRETSAPPTTTPRARAFSPAERREMMTTPTGFFAHAYSHAPTSHPGASADVQTPTIDENGEYSAQPSAVYGQARQVSIRHSYSMSNMSQTSMRSRDSSINGRTSRTAVGRFRTKRSHVALRRARQNSAEAELDYTPAELARMTYQQLAEEDFDSGPPKHGASSMALDFPQDVTTLEEKCGHLVKLPDNRSESSIEAGAKSTHELFFASLPIDDYEECGDFIVGQLTDIMSRLRKTRQAKRRVARDFENEVAKREDMVSAKFDGLQKELTRLKKSGQEALTAAIASSAT